jgi:Zn-dependent peptidase ImmA (M78 family)
MASHADPAASANHYRSPDELLTELGIDSPEDIRIEAIAQHCGATVVYETMQGSEARLIGYGKKAFITVNAQSTLPRQRFSAAHELGHWMWDRGKSAFACGGDALLQPLTRGEANPERRANRYAVDLLLPRPMFYRQMTNTQGSLRAIEEVAKVFQTSLTATALRWVELDAAPLILVAYGPKGRLWWAKSSNVSPDVELKMQPDKLSAAHQLLTTDRPSVDAIPLRAPFWIEHADALSLLVREDSVRLTSDLVLSLLTLERED